MTEEIINGIDVSGCRFLDEYEHCGICKELCEGHCLILQDIECKTYEDCYYRQLKRLEQENAKLKEENFNLDFKLGQIDIKKITLVENRQLAEENAELKEKFLNINGKCYSYQLALEEIKKISKNAFAVCDDDCGNANKFMDIINKVNEVLKDE